MWFDDLVGGVGLVRGVWSGVQGSQRAQDFGVYRV